MIASPRPSPADSDRRAQPSPAVYGLSRRLGDVEFLSAHFMTHRFAPHSHPGFAVGAVRSGASRIWHRGASYVARPGDLVLINPGAPHSADPAAPDAWDYCAVYFTIPRAAAWTARTTANTRFDRVVGHHPDLAARLDALCGTLAEDPEHRGSERLFAPFIRELFARFGSVSADPGDTEDETAPWAARRYLDAHFTDVVRIEHLADLTGRSPYSLIRAFSRAFGMAPYTYLSHVRVARAQELLRLGRPISDTAFAVGFSDQSHLTRFFRRVVGVPPGVWARAVTQTPPQASPQASPELAGG